MRKQLSAWIVLGLVALVSGLLLSGTNQMTKDVIAEQQVQSANKARQTILTEATAFETIDLEGTSKLSTLYVGKADDQVKGYVGSMTINGFGGPIEVMAGVNTQGEVTGIDVGGASFAETAGLGAKAKDKDFIDQFIGKKPTIKVIKAGGEKTEQTVDTITAATITSNAVASAVNTIAKNIDTIINPPSETTGSDAPAGARGIAKGFGGEVTVEVQFGDAGTIKSLRVLDDPFSETAGIGDRVLETDFAAQFIGKKAPLHVREQAEDVKEDTIDALAGATVSSTAVVNAVNDALKNPVTQPAAEQALKASEQGFAGPIEVAVVLNPDGTIKSVAIDENALTETPGLGTQVADNDFLTQFTGKKAPLHVRGGDEAASDATIDAISGATVSSTSAVAAVNKAIAEAGDMPAAEPVKEEVKAEEPAKVDEKAEAVAAPEEKADVKAESDGKLLKASEQGFAGPIDVAVVLNADGSIKSVSVDEATLAETAGLGTRVTEAEFLDQFVGKKAPLHILNKDEKAGDTTIDAVSGATVSSTAVVDAVNKAIVEAGDLPAAEPAKEEVKTEEPAKADEKTEAVAALEQKADVKAESNEKLLKASEQGFAGPIDVAVALNVDGSIKSVTVDEATLAETAGLGTRVTEAEFLDQFVGKKAPLHILEKDEKAGDTTIDAVSGATVSSTAVVDAVNRAIAEAGDVPAAEPAKEEVKTEEPAKADEKAEAVAAPEQKADVKAKNDEKPLKASEQGFAGPIDVAVALNVDGSIKSVTVDEATLAETAGLGTRVTEAEFLNQFSGKKAPLHILEKDEKAGDTTIDAVSGATVSSTAVVAAVNRAIAEDAEKSAETTEDQSSKAEQVFKATKEGFAGPIEVSVALDKEGKIKSVAIDESQLKETVGLGSRVAEAEFLEQFVGKTAPLHIREKDEKASDTTIDALSGATVSSEAVVDAVNAACQERAK